MGGFPPIHGRARGGEVFESQCPFSLNVVFQRRKESVLLGIGFSHDVHACFGEFATSQRITEFFQQSVSRRALGQPHQKAAQFQNVRWIELNGAG